MLTRRDVLKSAIAAPLAATVGVQANPVYGIDCSQFDLVAVHVDQMFNFVCTSRRRTFVLTPLKVPFNRNRWSIELRERTFQRIDGILSERLLLND